MLNGLWLGFFLVAAVSAFSRWLGGGDASVFAAMVESLDSRLKDDPNNIEGWKRLVRSYAMLEQPDKAAEALRRGLVAFPADSENGKALIALARELGVSEEGKTQ